MYDTLHYHFAYLYFLCCVWFEVPDLYIWKGLLAVVPQQRLWIQEMGLPWPCHMVFAWGKYPQQEAVIHNTCNTEHISLQKIIKSFESFPCTFCVYATSIFFKHAMSKLYSQLFKIYIKPRSLY